jgi:hypothetical protein
MQVGYSSLSTMYFYLFCGLVIVQKPRLHGISNSHKENLQSNWGFSNLREATKKKKKTLN